MRSLVTELALPAAWAWVAWQERRILALGVPLGQGQLRDARAIGVAHPERIRLLRVSHVPLPGGALARKLGPLVGSSWDQTIGLTARYGIFLRDSFWNDRRLLAHELAHTRQYEELGGIRPFLRRYLNECLSVGYVSAPMEREADAAAERICFP